MTRWPSYLMLGAGMVLMQIHGGQAWFAWVGWFALAWSPALEGAALFGWWKDSKGLAYSASALLVFGALYTLSGETVEGMVKGYINAQQAADTRAEIAQLEGSLTRYDENSSKKLGWAERIDRTQARLDAARERLRTLLAAPEAGRIWWRDAGVIVYQALALLAVMVAQIQAVISLRPDPAPKATKPERQPKAAGPDPAITETAVTDFDRLVSRVADRIETAGAPGKAIAAGAGVRPADISMIRNHARRKATGQETVSEPAVRKVSAYLDQTTTIGARA